MWSFKKDTAKKWFKRCLRIFKEKYERPVFMVIDNASCHSGIKEILDEDEFLGQRVLILGPYSPMLNPIKHVLSVVKVYVKRAFAAKVSEILNKELETMAIKDFCLQALEQLITKAMDTIDVIYVQISLQKFKDCFLWPSGWRSDFLINFIQIILCSFYKTIFLSFII